VPAEAKMVIHAHQTGTLLSPPPIRVEVLQDAIAAGRGKRRIRAGRLSAKVVRAADEVSSDAGTSDGSSAFSPTSTASLSPSSDRGGENAAKVAIEAAEEGEAAHEAEGKGEGYETTSSATFTDIDEGGSSEEGAVAGRRSVVQGRQPAAPRARSTGICGSRSRGALPALGVQVRAQDSGYESDEEMEDGKAESMPQEEADEIESAVAEAEARLRAAAHTHGQRGRRSTAPGDACSEKSPSAVRRVAPTTRSSGVQERRTRASARASASSMSPAPVTGVKRGRASVAGLSKPPTRSVSRTDRRTTRSSGASVAGATRSNEAKRGRRG
jgi:hypothetical protein